VVYHVSGTLAPRTHSTAARGALRARGKARVGDVEYVAAVAARQQHRPPVGALGELEALERVPRVDMERRSAF